MRALSVIAFLLLVALARGISLTSIHAQVDRNCPVFEIKGSDVDENAMVCMNVNTWEIVVASIHEAKCGLWVDIIDVHALPSETVNTGIKVLDSLFNVGKLANCHYAISHTKSSGAKYGVHDTIVMTRHLPFGEREQKKDAQVAPDRIACECDHDEL